MIRETLLSSVSHVGWRVEPVETFDHYVWTHVALYRVMRRDPPEMATRWQMAWPVPAWTKPDYVYQRVPS